MPIKTLLAFGLLFVLVPTAVLGQPGYRKGQASAAEVLMLPQFCWWEFNAAYKDSERQIQNCGVGMNHYCVALLGFNRSQSTPDRGRKIQGLQGALREVEYTLGWMKRNNTMDTCSIRDHVLQSYTKVRLAFPNAGMPVPPDNFPVQHNTPIPVPSAGSPSDGHKPTEEPNRSAEPPAQSTETPAEAAPIPPKIGSPTSPYCRFCPD
jgi:hypothetical protein